MAAFKRWATHLGGLFFLALFVVFILQICARFVFDRPMPWTDELAVVLYLWVIFWACAFMVPASEHVHIDYWVNWFSPSGRRWLHAMGRVMLGGWALWALPACWEYVWFLRRETTAVLGLPLFWVFLPLFVALLSLVVQACHSVWQLTATGKSKP